MAQDCRAVAARGSRALLRDKWNTNRMGPDWVLKACASQLSISASHKGVEFDEVPYVKGLENPAEVFPNVARWLVKHSYRDEDIAKVLGLNVVRVLKETWAR